MTERINMRRHTHFITGPKGTGGFLFRKYTPEEHESFHFNNGANAGTVYRLEFAPEQPGDVVLDLGCDELNEKLRGLLDEALQKWGVSQFEDFTIRWDVGQSKDFMIIIIIPGFLNPIPIEVTGFSIEDEDKISKVPIGAVLRINIHNEALQGHPVAEIILNGVRYFPKES